MVWKEKVGGFRSSYIDEFRSVSYGTKSVSVSTEHRAPRYSATLLSHSS